MQALLTHSVRRAGQAALMEATLQLLAWVGVVVGASIAAALAVATLFGT
jgi:hypothetical protein